MSSRTLAVGVGVREAGSPYEQGRGAACDALDQAAGVPPALALVIARNRGSAEDVHCGVREVLGDCPLLGIVSDAPLLADGPAAVWGVRVLLLASPFIKAKIGCGAAPGSTWEQEATEAFRGSFVRASESRESEESPERDLYRWYRYRRPALAIAVVSSLPAERRFRTQKVAAFLRKRLHGSVPILLFSQELENEEPAVLVDDRIVRSGVALAMIKTDLRFAVDRFHHFEPLGDKLFASRTDGCRIVELNGRPALGAYLGALGIPESAAPDLPRRLELFSHFPIATRSRDGRYHLMLPESVGDDGSLLMPARPSPDHALYPMRAVSSSEVLRSNSDGPGPEVQDGAVALILRHQGLRDVHAAQLQDSRIHAPVARTVEVPFGTELSAHISHRDWEGEASHFLLSLEDVLDPNALTAVENERLLGEVMHLKDLNEKILDGIGDGIALVEAEGRIRHCNQAYRAIMALPQDVPSGMRCPLDGCSPAVCSPCAAREAIERQAFVTHEVSLKTPLGVTWLRMDAFPLRAGPGPATAAVEVIRDVTVYKQLSQTLDSERHKLEAVVHGMAETLYIAGPHYKLEFFHRGALPLSAEDERDIQGRICYEVLFNRDFPCPWCRLPDTLATGVVDRRIAHLPGPDGEECAYQITFSPWRDAQGVTQSVACLLVDISSQRRMEQQMIRSEKLNSLAILSAGMAHELNNPLGAISFNLEVLKRRERDPEYQEVLGSIKKDILRINRIVGNLLSFSRSGVSSYTWLRLPEVIDSALELFQVVVERRKVAVRKTYQADMPSIWANVQDLQQVFINLISNAVDAMPAGGVIEIAVSASAPSALDAKPPRIAVVYDRHDDITLLRTLLDVPTWDVRFFRGDDEAIDHLRQQQTPPPEVVILDYAEINEDRVNFLMMMVREAAPQARVLLIENHEVGEAEREARTPGVHGFQRRSKDGSELIEAVRRLTPEGAAAEPPGVVVAFGDTGVGIPLGVQERIFDPFFTTKSENKGTGLGLSVVHKILENHGATIRVRSAPGQGTTFTLTFPQGQGMEKSALTSFPNAGRVGGEKRWLGA